MKKGGIGTTSPASRPLGYPASARSCLAFAGSYAAGSTCSAKSITRGTMTPAGGQKPRHAASLMALRPSAWFTASRSRRSLHGELWIALLRELQPRDRGVTGRHELHLRVAPDDLGVLPVERVRDVGLARPQHRCPGRDVGHALHDERLTCGTWRLYPANA